MNAKIALWGYGHYGRCMEQMFSRYPDERYTVTAIFDRQASVLGCSEINGLKIQGPELAEQLYREHVYDRMLVTVYDGEQRKAVMDWLEERGIPVWIPAKETPMRSAAYFELTEKPQPLKEEGYTLYSFRDQYMEILRHNGIRFVFNREGMLNGAYWHLYQRSFDYATMLYQPDFRGQVRELEGEWCILSGVFGKNYWHFTYESLDHLQVMENAGYRGKYLVYHTPFAEELLKLAGADLSRIVWMDSLEYDTVYHFEKLVCTEMPDDSIIFAAPVLMQVAKTVKENLPPPAREYPERIFVKRIGTRKLIMDDALPERYGFVTIVPEELTVAEQIRYFEQAKIVLCPHGANSANSLYMRPGSVLIETFPNSYINHMCLDTLRLQGVYYIPLTQRKEPSMPEGGGPYKDYDIDPKLLDLAVHAAEALTEK